MSAALKFPLTLKEGAQYFPLPWTPHDNSWRSRLLWEMFAF